MDMTSHGQSAPLLAQPPKPGEGAPDYNDAAGTLELDARQAAHDGEGAAIRVPAASQAQTPGAPISAWLRFGLAWVACVLCGGILPGQALFTQQFAAAGVFRSVCDQNVSSDLAAPVSGPLPTCPEQYLALGGVFGVLSMVATLAFFFSGLLLDLFGGRATGVAGAGALLVGLTFIVISLELVRLNGYTDSALSLVLFPLGAIITDLGCLVNSMSLFAFLFHLPGRHGVIVSMSNNCYYLSALLPLVLERGIRVMRGGREDFDPEHGEGNNATSSSPHEVYGGHTHADADQPRLSYPRALQLALVIYGVCCVALFAVPVFLLAVPSPAEYRKKAQEAIGVPVPRPPSTRLWRRTTKSIKQVKRILTFHPKYLRGHWFVVFSSLLGGCGAYVYQSMPQPFGAALFPEEHNAGQKLGALVTANLAWVGMLAGPATGAAIDCGPRGLSGVALLQAFGLLVVSVCAWMPSWNAQLLAASGANLFTATNTTVLMKYVLSFAAPQRVGVVTGGFFAVFSVVAVPALIVVSATVGVLAPASGGSDIAEFAQPTSVLCTSGAVFFVVMARRLRVDESSGDKPGPTATMLTEPKAASACLVEFFSRPLLPAEPPLLPEDERELAQRFLVSNLNDAALVMGLPRKELLRLCASSDVRDMRALVEKTAESWPRYLELAVRQVEENFERLKAAKRERLVAIPVEGTLAPASGQWEICDRAIPANEAALLLANTFWPADGEGAAGSPFAVWMSGGRKHRSAENAEDLEPVSERPFFLSLLLQHELAAHISAGCGHALVLKERKSGEVATILLATPPGVRARAGSLELASAAVAAAGGVEAVRAALLAPIGDKSRDKLKVGMPALPPALQARAQATEVAIDENMMAEETDTQNGSEGASSPRGSRGSWYVSVLGTMPGYRGQGGARRLLDIAQGWARRDGVPLRLETDGLTASFYERCGFRTVWRERVFGGDDDREGLEMVGLERW